MTKEEIKLLSVKKSPYRSEYVFPKKQQFFKMMRNVLAKFGFDWYEIENLGRPWDEKIKDFALDKELKIKEVVEEIDSYDNEKFSVEIIYFSHKIYLIINSKEDEQKKIAKILEEFLKE